ncbi:smg6 nonsense mediated mRNA decay factor isoform X1 [Rhynchophorus ferrugineus]|uniref:smg6 nonsense mediated mRNA decay factor isoform X1 n=1 Tax=Rhynchophorus ferrugineus TaxID=354439 RepID=UPI003FCEE4FA
MRRGRPQQDIYVPGSGKLRRSSQCSEDTFSESLCSNDLRTVSASQSDLRSKSDTTSDLLTKDLQKRTKRPDRLLYVPKPIQAREQLSPQYYDQDSSSIQNGGDRILNTDNKMSKRYSNNRTGYHGNNSGYNQNERGDKSPGSNKSFRMGSEPRGFHSGSNWSNDQDRYSDRDTRSMEPTGLGNRSAQVNKKIQSKPPSGRRHSIIGNIDNIPPRFRKKMLDDNRMTGDSNRWDNSATGFQPLQQSAGTTYHSMENCNTLPTYQQSVSNTNVGYYTLPGRPRGRGRLQDSDYHPAQPFRSLTPESFLSNSRPGTPTRRFDNRPSSRSSSRCHTPNSYYEDARSNNDFRGDRGKSAVFDRLGDRFSETRQFERSDRRNDDYGRTRIGEENRGRRDDIRNAGFDENRNRRNDFTNENDRGKPDRTRREHPRKGDRHRRRGGRDKRSSSRDTLKPESKDAYDSCQSEYNPTTEIHNRTDVHTRDFQNSSISSTSLASVPLQQVSDTTSSLDNHSNQSGDGIPDINIERVEKLDEDRVILDWNEEVDLIYKLETEALSDCMTRSSSVTSLQEISTKSMPSSITTTPNSKKKRKSGRRRRSGSNYRDKTPVNTRNRQDSITSIESRDNFRVPHTPHSNRGDRRRRRDSRAHREASFDQYHNRSRGPSRDVSFDRSNSTGTSENWRDEIRRSRQNSDREGSVLSRRISSDRSRTNSELEDHPIDSTIKKAGILVLPPKSPELSQNSNIERPKFPEIKQSPPQQKTLFDPNNPKKPILVKSPGSRVAVPGFSDNSGALPPQMYTTDQFGNLRPTWYDENSSEFKSSHYQELLRDIKRADTELQYVLNNGLLLVNYETVDNLRQFLKSALEYLLSKAIKFCQGVNVEQHIWKILYYNIIEVTRKAITNDPDKKQQFKEFLLYLIEEGTKYFEHLITILEDTYKFKVSNYIGNNSMIQQKGLGYIGLALVSTQKIFLFLGDLGRYKEQVNETSNYGRCRQWYIKSHEINPKNGKPYNQLAVLAVYSKRKLDAVYYYMRSLMSSNPVPSARESLIALFDENRKKFEQGEKKRREERLERQRQHMKQKESEGGARNFLRRETWIPPEGGRVLHRTTKAVQDESQDSEEEDLAALSSVDVNKRFVISYLHVHGKLINKIGMETFQDAAMQMLKEFRALLQHSPVPLPSSRFLQLLALNMFAIDSTQLKDPQLQQAGAAYRSEYQERALVVSLQMFNLILERCVSILQEYAESYHQKENKDTNVSPFDSLPPDANVLLPSIKIWCDWMLCHTSIWNPPPSIQDFKVGSSGDLWSKLGVLMNILENLDQDAGDIFSMDPKEDCEPVRLPEDGTLYGFTPLMFKERETSYAPAGMDSEIAQSRLRISKMLFFGTVYLCGLEPPVLKLEIEDGRREYVSVVTSERGSDSPRDDTILARNDEVLLETFSGEEDEAGDDANPEVAQSTDLSGSSVPSSEIRDLLSRKIELEKKKKSQELHRQRVMKILSQSVVSVHLEIRPKYLVPDTNCFIDHLDSIQNMAKSHTYTVMVPIVVLSELEGLSKGTPLRNIRGPALPNIEHVQKVAQASRLALDFLKKRHSAVKCVTTRGAVLASTTFSTEDDATWDGTVTNDDKILSTCLFLCKNSTTQQELKKGEPRYLVREVVLLTEDRNLRVKAHARDVPVRALPDFLRWAGLG